ncbi:MAG: hypothetical protein OXH06_16405 [Gemmatimonadetes bacterium]|nr:hypothetical protein [Gemmatimonadota bacterium]
MEKQVVFVAALVAIAAGVCAASESRPKAKGSIEEFKLYTKCVGVSLVVEHKSQGAEETGLKRKQIIAAVETRLRSAGLFQSSFFGFSEGSVVFQPHLYMHVNVIGQSFCILLELKKWVHEPLSGQLNYSQTWRTETSGVHGTSSRSIMASVHDLTDQFIDEWNKVNKRDGKCVE